MTDTRAQDVLTRRHREITGRDFPMRILVVTTEGPDGDVEHFVVRGQWVMTLYPDEGGHSAYVAIKGSGVN